MLKKITFPKLSAKTEVGTLIAWSKGEGESIKSGEVLYEVETEKAVHEVEVTDSGKIAQLYKLEGDQVSIGEVIAEIEIGEAKP